MTSIQHHTEPTGGTLVLEGDQQKIATMTYSSAGSEALIIEHIEVADEQRGVGHARRLVETLVAFAREHDLSIIPLCPVANGIMKRTPAWRDVVDTRDDRERPAL